MTFISGPPGRAAREVGARLRARAGRHELVGAAVAPAAVTAATQKLDAVGDDLDRLALRAVLRLPLAPFEAAIDRDRAPLAQVLRAALGLVAENRDAGVVLLVDPLPRLVHPAAVHGDSKTADRGAARRMPELGIAGQV